MLLSSIRSSPSVPCAPSVKKILSTVTVQGVAAASRLAGPAAHGLDRPRHPAAGDHEIRRRNVLHVLAEGDRESHAPASISPLGFVKSFVQLRLIVAVGPLDAAPAVLSSGLLSLVEEGPGRSR